MVEHKRNMVVHAVHTKVKGRIRFDIAGLYRSVPMKKKLENRLMDLEGVGSARANPLTGRLLVVFCPKRIVPDILVDDILELVVDCVELRPMPRLRKKNASPLSGEMFQGTLKRATRILESLDPRHLSALPVGAASGLIDGGVDDRRQQQTQSWHVMAKDDVLSQLNITGTNGLSMEEAGVRLRAYGPNEIQATEKRSDLLIFIDQFNSLPVGLLGVSAVISLLTGGALDAAVILGVVLINSAIGFVTERQAEKTIRSLADTGVRVTQVLRDGKTAEIPLADIVPGDILLLAPGAYVAADVRLVNSHRLSVDESALTGESLPVKKIDEMVAAEDTPLGDRVNMAYMGTHVTGGNGQGVVVATATATELGKIQTMVGEAEAPDTPMQKQLDNLGTQLALLSGAVCAGVGVIGMARGFSWLEMLKSSVSLAVAAVPEGLPAVATTTLAMGIKDMRSRNVAVRHLTAVETLGSVQVFCLDKTGTLTMNRMAVVSVATGDSPFAVTDGMFVKAGDSVDVMANEELVRLMQVVSLCSETVLVGKEDIAIEGSATESALVEMAISAGIDVGLLRDQCPTLKIRHRAEGRPFMSTLHSSPDGKHLLAVKGSPDEVLAISDYYMKDGKRVRLNQTMRDKIIAENERMAGDALRVLGVAFKDLTSARMPRSTGNLVWLGLAGMADPMRTGMNELMSIYHRAGIKTVMITGDQSATAQAIGRQLGLSEGRPLNVMESGALESLDPALLAGLVKDVHVFARVSPAHKLKIVRALQDAGNVVAMTGDGINDGPALKAADIGVAMGESGTDVARAVSDVVLEDDNLHTMEVAVSQGRTIYNNIRKTIHFMVSTNLTEIEVMLVGIAAGVGQPMNPMQLLWINLVTDIFPGLALSMEPAEPDVMERNPRDPGESIISGKDLKRMVFESGVIGVGTMAAYLYGRSRYGIGAPQASTMAFTSLTVNELVHAMSSRSGYRMLFSKNKLPPNPYLNKAVVGMLGAQALAMWVPTFRRLLGTSPLGIIDLAIVAASVFGPFLVNEFTKPKRPASAASDAEETPKGAGEEATVNWNQSNNREAA